MTAERVQRELAEALSEFANEHGLGFSPWEHDRFAAALRPAVQALVAAGKAEALGAAIAEISRDRDNCPNKVRRQGYGGALYVLKSRLADALTPSGDRAQEAGQ